MDTLKVDALIRASTLSRLYTSLVDFIRLSIPNSRKEKYTVFDGKNDNFHTILGR